MALSDIPAPEIALMTAGWISFILYITIVFTIIRNMRSIAIFRGAFFKLMLSQAFSELLLFLYVEFIMRPRKYAFSPIVPNVSVPQSAVAQWISYFTVLIKDSVIIGFLGFALNRFTAIYLKIWTNRTIAGVILFNWLLPVVVTTPLYLQPNAFFSFIWTPSKGTLQMLLPEDVRRTDALMGLCFTGLVLVFCVPLYTLSAIEARRRISGSHKMDELMLLFCSILSFTSMSLDVYRNIVQYLVTNVTSLLQPGVDVWYYSTELIIIFQPWIILFTNGLVRRKVFSLIPRFSNANLPPATVTSARTNATRT